MRLALVPILILVVASAGCGGVPLTLTAIAPAGTDPLTCAEMEALLAGYDLERREGSADLVAIRDARGSDVDKLTMSITDLPQPDATELRVVATKVEENRAAESIGPINIGFDFGGEKAPDTRTETDARSIVSECAGPPIEVADTVPEASSP
jgi:hypothetical protein